MRKTNRVYLVTWSYPGGGWCTVRAYVDTKAQAELQQRISTDLTLRSTL